MDFNTLLLLTAGSSCAAILVAALRASPRNRGWVFVCMVIAAVGGAAWWYRPQFAGDLTGGLWALLVLTPALTLRAARSAMLRQHFGRAAIYSTIAGFLHPFDGWPQQSTLIGAMSVVEQGQIEAAIATLRKLQIRGSAQISRTATVHIHRLSEDWQGLIDWVRTTIEPKQLLKDANVLPLYIRALGETGQLSEMLNAAVNCRISQHPMLAMNRSMCRMFAMVFTGRPRQVEEALASSLSKLPEPVRRYWIATATFAAGMTTDAEREMTTLLPIASPGLKIAIDRRLANPPPPASSILTAADREVLRQLELQQDQDLRFSQNPGAHHRPWITWTLIVANMAMFVAEWALGAGPGNWLNGGTMSDTVLDKLGEMLPDIMQSRQYYRLFTVNFLHFGYAHILMNMLVLLVFGPYVEFCLGRITYLLLYLVSGVAVAATVLYLQTHGWIQPGPMVGASGAIMAVIGATAAILLRGLYRERAASAFRRLLAIAVILAVEVVFDHFTPQVSGSAHIAGVIWGFLLASLLPHHRRSKPQGGFPAMTTSNNV